MNSKNEKIKDLFQIIFDYMEAEKIYNYKYYYTSGDLYFYNYNDILKVLKHLYKNKRSYYYLLSVHHDGIKKHRFKDVIHETRRDIWDRKHYYILAR